MLKMTNMYMIQHLYNSKTKKHCQCSKSLVTHGSILRNGERLGNMSSPGNTAVNANG